MVAETPGAAGEGTVPIGAAWWQYFSAADRAMAMWPTTYPRSASRSSRGQGVGRALLRGIADMARAAGLSRLSLSVERANRAARLYAAEGYEIAGGDALAGLASSKSSTRGREWTDPIDRAVP